MPKRTYLSETDKQKIINDYIEGRSVCKLMQIYHCGPKKIYDILNENTITIRTTEEQIAMGVI